MTELLHHTDFEPWLHTPFRLHFTSELLMDAILEEVNLLNGFTPADRKPFSLIFKSKQKTEYFSQAMCILEHPEKGEIPIFLVPLGFDGEGMRYEAIFS